MRLNDPEYKRQKALIESIPSNKIDVIEGTGKLKPGKKIHLEWNNSINSLTGNFTTNFQSMVVLLVLTTSQFLLQTSKN